MLLRALAAVVGFAYLALPAMAVHEWLHCLWAGYPCRVTFSSPWRGRAPAAMPWHDWFIAVQAVLVVALMAVLFWWAVEAYRSREKGRGGG